MKKIIGSIITITFFFILPTSVSAQLQGPGLPGNPGYSATQTIRTEIDSAVGLSIGGKTGADLKLGDILSALLPYLYVAGGFILFLMMVWGGFEMLTGATESKSQEAGKQRITTAVIGFILLFVSYWIAQILQIIFGIRIL